MRSFIILHGFVLFSLSSFAQSGWTREKKTFFLNLGYTFYNGTNYHNLEGTSIKTSKFSQSNVALYAEYGLTDRLALQGYLPIFKRNKYDNTEGVNGIGDLKLELKYAVLKGAIPVSISLAPELPTGPRNLYAKNLLNPEERINLPTGDGEFNLWTTVAASHSFSPLKAYTSIYSAYNWRTSYQAIKFQDQFQTGAEVGIKIKNILWLNAKLFALTGIGARPEFADFIRGNGTSYTAVTTGGLLEIGKHLGLSFNYFKCNDLIVKARNNYATGIFTTGIVYTSKR